MGKIGYMRHPMHRVMFILHCPDVSCGHCSAGLHCLFRHGEQRVDTLADFVAPKATGGVYTTYLSFIYQIK